MKLYTILFCAITFALLNISTCFAQVPTQSSKEYDGKLVDASQLINNGQYKEALKLLNMITSADPKSDAAYYYIGLAKMGSAEFKEAQEAFKKAAELDPKNYWYKDRLAVAYLNGHEDDLAMATYESLLSEYPKKNDLYFSLVNLYLRHNQLDKALSAIGQIENVFGKSEEVTSTKYQILLNQNKPEEALQALLDYNKEFSSPQILTQIGEFSMAEYKDSVALNYYKEALGLQSNYVPAVLGMAEVYRMRRDYPQFFKALDTFVSDKESEAEVKTQYIGMLLDRSEPRFIQAQRPQLDSLIDKLVLVHQNDSTTLSMAGGYYFSTQRIDKAKELLKLNMDTYPESVQARGSYAYFLGRIEQWKEMIEVCEVAKEKFPYVTDFLDIENSAYYTEKNYDGIVANCNRVLKLFPADTSRTIPAIASLGDIYYAQGKEKEAFKEYDKVLKLDPKNTTVLNNYAYYLSLKGTKLKKALEMSKITIEKEPDNPTFLDTIGWILHLLKRDKEAKPYFKHAMLYGGKDSGTCMSHYAVVLEALGETDLAKVYRSQAEAKGLEE